MTRVLIAILALCASPVFAGDEIWSAMILASHPAEGEKPASPPPELTAYAARLAKIFKYEQFEILGSASKTIGHAGQERWLVPSPTFMLGAQARAEGTSFRINLEIYQEKRRILQTEARLGLQSPLFISGPRHERGQLIIVFEIRP